MKRLACLLLVLMMAISCLLAACGGESEGLSETDTSQSESDNISESGTESKNEESNESSEAIIDESFSESAPSESKPDEESKEESKHEDSDPDEESKPEESEPPEDAIKLLFTRYTQSPYFAIIGKCAMGADVTAEYNGQTVTVPSYMGWFSVTLKNKDNSSNLIDITLSQSVDGEQYDIPRVYTAKPTMPPNKGTYAIGSNKAFQFFLEQMVPDYERTNLVSQATISDMTARVKEHLSKLRLFNKDAEIIYMIVPSPMTIYPELVPDYYTQGSGITRYDQVKEGLIAAGATVIDLRDTFTEHKHDEMPLYYHLDSHWADYGAFLAYTELFEHISKRFPEAKPRSIDEFKWTADYYTSADACLYLNIPQVNVKEYGYYREFDFSAPSSITSVPRYRGMQLIYNDLTTEERYFSTGNAKLPNCLVYRDSYSAGIYDLIPERMNKTHYVGMWSYAWQTAYIRDEQPDYVIYILSEWNTPQVIYN